MSMKSSKPITVLFVDDDPINLIVAQKMLGATFNILTASSAGEAIKLLTDISTINVIVMDVQMPSIDGIKAMSVIRKDMELQIPAIALTADKYASLRVLQAAGFTDLMVKPLDRTVACEKIRLLATYPASE